MTTVTLHKSILRAALALLVALAAWALQATYAAQAGANAAAERGSIVAGLPPASYASRATTAAAASAPLIISELRVRGPNGANDEFIEIYNNSDAPVTVTTSDGSTGFALAASNGVARFVIPNGTVIPARGHYLGVNSTGYSLASYPAGNGTTATGDATYTTDIPDNAGVALFCTSNAANFTLANRLDAVGTTSEANTLYKEGAGVLALTPFSIDYSFYRKLPGVTGNIPGTATATSRFPQDTNDNAADFLFVDTNGTSAGAGQRLGAPGPENLSSPVTTTADVTRTLLDPCVAAGSPPNRVRDFTSDPANNSTFGTLDLRRTFTNNTGANITRLRFRIQDITTFPAPSGVADLRPRTSTAVVVTVDRAPCGSGTSNVTVQGTTLEQPPSQPNGGGFNSSLGAGTVTLATPLAPGASIDVRFLFGIQQTGFYRLAVTLEALPGGGDLWVLCGNTETNNDVEGGCAVLPPTIAKSFTPTTINAGASSQLTLTFSNPAGNAALTNLAVTDNLPVGVTVAATPGLTNTCNGTATGATAGSSSFSLSGGMLAAGASSCQVQVNVTSSTPGMATNTTGNVTATGLSSNVMGDTASATLTVNPIQPPTVMKAFSPTSIALGGTSLLTITLGNTNPSLALTGAALTDTLPAGVTTVAATAATTCGGTASQTAGSVSLSGGAIPAGGSCTLSVQVTSATSGAFNNTIAAGDVTTGNGGANAAGASAMLTVTAVTSTPIVTIVDPFDCTGPGDVLTVTVAITNAAVVAQSIAFTSALPAGLVGLLGTGTSTVGAAPIVTATGATFGPTVLAAGQTATVTYQVQVGDVAGGAQLCINTTSTFSGAAGPPVQACATVNCPTVGPGLPFPATSEVSDQKAGSVLVYNLYSSSAASPNTQNTRLSITNTNPAADIAVHLFFVDGATCSIADAIICLTQNQTTTFLASDLDPGTTGYVVAVASDPTTGCPVNFNFLIGDEYVKLASGHQANLGAEAFAALAGGPVACDANALTATLNFDGVSYNRVPRTLAASSIPARNDGNDTLLVINRFGGNLAIGAATLTNLFGIFYDDAENALSFGFSPGVCQFRSSLSNNFPRTTPRLETFIPAGRSGWLRLYSQSDQGLLGALLNFNPNATTNAGAFNQGRNLHKLTLTPSMVLTIPIFPANCRD